ncbi:MAG: precorrin-6A reductase [Vallitalea sp.]|jgi:precorrin-6A/cobalt-precorrin-6A reductase|nr:precorrin-6A reductase [Vallitalea sp.]
MILILGGTSDSIVIANKIKEINREVILSTATEYGREIANNSFHGKIIFGKKDNKQLKDFCISNNIDLIIDATHPYANLISENAIVVSKELNIMYTRYERPLINKDYEKYIVCKSYEEASKLLNKMDGNILLTTGSKDVELILEHIQDTSRVYIRVLPQSKVIEKLENLNIGLSQIIAMKGPFTKELNKAIIDQTDCKVIVTKESGSQGKTYEKLVAASECNVKVVLIERPKINYPNTYYDIDELINEIKRSALDNESSSHNSY